MSIFRQKIDPIQVSLLFISCKAAKNNQSLTKAYYPLTIIYQSIHLRLSTKGKLIPYPP